MMTSWLAFPEKVTVSQTFCQNILFIILRNICSGYLFELPQWGDSNKYPNVYVPRGNKKKKTRPFLLVILLIKDYLQPQTHFNGNIFKNECCRCNEGSLYKGRSIVII